MPNYQRTDALLPPLSGPLMVFDGQCVFCSTGARLVCRLDRKARVRFAHAQSGSGEKLYRHYGWNPAEFETNILIDGEHVFTKWASIGAIGRAAGGVWRLLSVFDLVPDRIGDWIYDLVARNRYRIFGRTDACAVGDGRMRERMIDTA